MALKINPTPFITPFTTRLQKKPAIVTKRRDLDLARLSMHGTVVATLIVSSITLSLTSSKGISSKTSFLEGERFPSSAMIISKFL